METLEIITGFVFIFLLLSLLGTIVQEFISSAISLRGKVLIDGVISLLEIDMKDKPQVKAAREAITNTRSYQKLSGKYLFNIVSLMPSYLSAQQVLAVLQEVMQEQSYEGGAKAYQKHINYQNDYDNDPYQLADKTGRPMHIENLRENIHDTVLADSLEKLCRGLRNPSQDAPLLEKAGNNIVRSFDQLMDRASGWYKRRVQFMLIIIGFFIAVSFNADTLQIYRNLTSNPDDRNAMLALAEAFVNNGQIQTFSPPVDTVAAAPNGPSTLSNLTDMRLLVDSLIRSGIQSANSPLGLGWDEPVCLLNGQAAQTLHFRCAVVWIARKIPGWMITALAISLGASFWFDLLNKLIRIRIAGNRGETSISSAEGTLAAVPLSQNTIREVVNPPSTIIDSSEKKVEEVEMPDDKLPTPEDRATKTSDAVESAPETSKEPALLSEKIEEAEPPDDRPPTPEDQETETSDAVIAQPETSNESAIPSEKIEEVELPDDRTMAISDAALIQPKQGLETASEKTVPPTGARIPPKVHLREGRPEVRRANILQAFPLGENPLPFRDPSADSATKASDLLKIIRWLDVENVTHLRFRPIPKGNTFCNIYIYDYCYLAGVYLPRVWWSPSALKAIERAEEMLPKYGSTVTELNANALFDWFVEHSRHYGWQRIRNEHSPDTLTKIQEEHANQGQVCIICAKRDDLSRSGHICAIVPEDDEHRAERVNGLVIHPLQSQAGRRNHRFFTRSPVSNDRNWWQRTGFDGGFRDFGFWVHE